LTYLGPGYSRKLDGPEERLRGVPREITQEWLNHWRVRLDAKQWRIEGDDEDSDGIPDKRWNRKDIIEWLGGNGVELTGYTTKSRALELVNEVLNPPEVQEQLEVEETLEEEQLQGDDE